MVLKLGIKGCCNSHVAVIHSRLAANNSHEIFQNQIFGVKWLKGMKAIKKTWVQFSCMYLVYSKINV